MKTKKKIKILEAVCMASFLLAILGCENADGTLNAAWTLPLLGISCISGIIIKRNDHGQE